MYTNLFLVENWLEELTYQVYSLASPQPTSLKNAPVGYGQVHYYTSEHFNYTFNIKEYTELAKSALSKIDMFRDNQLIGKLNDELRAGQFDDKRFYLNDYIEKVNGKFFNLWMAGSDFEDVYTSVIPDSILDVEHYDDGVLYYYENEEIELVVCYVN